MSEDSNNTKPQESLFSLEVVVEKLITPSVACRFPAVAFRLLDYPTLLIYHVEPDLADTIRTKINADPHYKVPPQLQELKDKSGYFILKKGKSCLFKVEYGTLQSHLMNIPLYVMIIDTYPKVPKLLGNCTIPLDAVITRINDDINHHGLSMPSSHGERGEYKLYNLMGFEIGNITLGYRLVSLGRGLIPHIPDNAIPGYVEEKSRLNPAHRRDPFGLVPNVDKSSDNKQDVDAILQSVMAVDTNTQVGVSELVPVSEDMHTQTEKETHPRSSGMQTGPERKKRVRHRHRDTAGLDTFTEVNKEMSDFFVTNMTCPPPMFYNSDADDVYVYQQSLQQGLTFNEQGLRGVQSPTPNYAWTEEQSDDWSSYSDSTIRNEDVFSDSDVEQEVDFPASRVVYKDRKKSSCKNKMQVRRMTNNQVSEHSTHLAQDIHINKPYNFKQLQQFPLLNTLIKEIMTLQGVTASASMQTTSTVNTSRSTSPQSKTARKDTGEREQHLKKLSTPRSGQPKQKNLHDICVTKLEQVPRNKSWMRKEPDISVNIQKTKLSYGMTNAQRLRLAKTNPELLKKLEKKDEERIQKSREKTRQKYAQTLYQREAKLGDRLMQSVRKTTAEKIPQEPVDVGPSVESRNVDMSDVGRIQRRPIPAPRKSLSLKTEEVQEVLAKIAEKDARGSDVDASKSNQIDRRDDTMSQRSGSDAVKSNSSKIQPEKTSNALLKNRSHSNTENESSPSKPRTKNSENSAPIELDNVPDFGRTKTLPNSRFPSERQPTIDDTPSRPDSRLTDYGQYSEDFANDTEQSHSKSQSSLDEPSLKRVFDHYSESDDSASKDLVEHMQKIISKTTSGDDQSTSRSDSVSSYFSTRSGPKLDAKGAVPTLKVGSILMPNPRASIHSPVAAIRSHVPSTGLPAPTHTQSDMAMTQPSTAYIRESQMPSNMTSETAESSNPYTPLPEMAGSSDTFIPLADAGTTSEPFTPIVESASTTDMVSLKANAKTRSSSKAMLTKTSSVHTDSVSSYTPSDGENMAFETSGLQTPAHLTESYEVESNVSDGPEPVKQMSDLHLAPEARMGYTWGNAG